MSNPKSGQHAVEREDSGDRDKNLGSETLTPHIGNHPRTTQATRLVPMDLSSANAFVAKLHRHHKPVVGHKFSIGLAEDLELKGVVIVGRPVSRHQDDGATLEVTRCCTDGIRNGCSMLYRAAWRVALNLGYRRLITYTLATEAGSSLRGAQFKLIGKRGGGSWDRENRPRIDKHPTGEKLLWELQAA